VAASWYEGDEEIGWAEGLHEDWWPNLVCMTPPLAAISGITALTLLGKATLPPDLRQLSGLQRLVACVPARSGLLAWGAEPLTGLTALSRLVVAGDMPGERLNEVSASGQAAERGVFQDTEVHCLPAV
jgi:hypothetical protein